MWVKVLRNGTGPGYEILPATPSSGPTPRPSVPTGVTTPSLNPPANDRSGTPVAPSL